MESYRPKAFVDAISNGNPYVYKDMLDPNNTFTITPGSLGISDYDINGTISLFDPVKIEISTNYLMYKSFFIKTFLKSWRIRGPSVDLSNESASVDDIPCDIVDIMCEGMFSVTRDAEEALGKV